MMIVESSEAFVLCVENGGYEASLEKRKVYRRIDDEVARDEGLVRVVDESGESYLFPATFFVAVTIPEAAEAVFEEIETSENPDAASGI